MRVENAKRGRVWRVLYGLRAGEEEERKRESEREKGKTTTTTMGDKFVHASLAVLLHSNVLSLARSL